MSDIKIKPIKQGMVIHCSKQEEADELFKMLRELGYTWYFGDDLKHKFYERYNEDTCYCVEENLKITYDRISFFKNNKFETTEFSDLIEPDISPEEAT